MNKQQKRFEELTELLLTKMNKKGFWDGKLSSSALAVAVSVTALHFFDANKYKKEIMQGFDWLESNINPDGGYGDTPGSKSNISTSLLVYAALNLYHDKTTNIRHKLSAYLQSQSIDLQSDRLQKAILAHYQKDYTFSVPILTMCAFCGLPEKDPFDKIPQLPFELVLLPRKLYKILNLSVVSYAIPALVAVGIALLRNKQKTLFGKLVREKAVNKSLVLLERIMPQSGGFLEAIPLTAFVCLSLVKSGYAKNNVVKSGINFLLKTQREDGSWPIDIDLSTWVSTLAVKSLVGKLNSVLSESQRSILGQHLLSIQNKSVHPFNGTSPGGWGWTHYSGSVPDCDDTPGTIIALIKLGNEETYFSEIYNGIEWLLKTQNRDGGFPTFSKGWGKLPFDRSCCDLTAHNFLAFSMVYGNGKLSKKKRESLRAALLKSCRYLIKNQQKTGVWLPLWFGNQYNANQRNPIYGTARVAAYLKEALQYITSEKELSVSVKSLLIKAETFLINSQKSNGSWGSSENGDGTIEETSLVLSAIYDIKKVSAIEKGFDWLDNYYGKNGLKASPIGLYFAYLWYDEDMYPLVTYLEALSKHGKRSESYIIKT